MVAALVVHMQSYLIKLEQANRESPFISNDSAAVASTAVDYLAAAICNHLTFYDYILFIGKKQAQRLV